MRWWIETFFSGCLGWHLGPSPWRSRQGVPPGSPRAEVLVGAAVRPAARPRPGCCERRRLAPRAGSLCSVAAASAATHAAPCPATAAIFGTRRDHRLPRGSRRQYRSRRGCAPTPPPMHRASRRSDLCSSRFACCRGCGGRSRGDFCGQEAGSRLGESLL